MVGQAAVVSSEPRWVDVVQLDRREFGALPLISLSDEMRRRGREMRGGVQLRAATEGTSPKKSPNARAGAGDFLPDIKVSSGLFSIRGDTATHIVPE